VVAQLEALVGEEAHLFVTPRGLLAFDAALAEKCVSCRRTGQHAERGLVGPVRMRAVKLQPNADRAVGIYLESSIVIDVAELRGRGVVEREDDGRHAGRKGNLAIDQLGNRYGTIAPLIEELELPLEVSALDGPTGVGVPDDVILEDWNPTELVSRARWFDVRVFDGRSSAGSGRQDNEHDAKCRKHEGLIPWGREGYSLPLKKSMVRRVARKP